METLRQSQFELPDRWQLEAWRTEAEAVWRDNLSDGLIKPSHELYGADGNTWGYAWDTALAAETIAGLDPEVAADMVTTYLSCQHPTGRIPHMVMRSDSFPIGAMATNVNWHGWRQRGRDVTGRRYKSSPITQPPLKAVAAAAVVDNLPDGERRVNFAKSAATRLARYHSWLYRTRELRGDGLVATIHPHETGRDDAPSHVELLQQIPVGWRERVWLSKLSRRIFHANRLDKAADPASRSDTDTVMRAASLAIFSLKPFGQHNELVPAEYPYQHFDVGFNSILDRANDELQRIAQIGSVALPGELVDAMARTADGIQQFWEPSAKAFRGIDARGIVEFPAGREIGDLLPLYSSHITKEQTTAIAAQLRDSSHFGGIQLPSVSRRSQHYDADAFWRGSSWPPMYALLLSGAERSPHAVCHELVPKFAHDIVDATITFPSNKFPEYRDADSGEPKGARNFTWAATLLIRAIDILTADGRLEGVA